MDMLINVYDMDRTMDAAQVVQSFKLDARPVDVKDADDLVERGILYARDVKDPNREYAVIRTKDGAVLVLPNSNLEITDDRTGVWNMRSIAYYKHDTPKYKRLCRAAEILNEKMGCTTEKEGFYVSDTWFDYGQRWGWSTVLYRRPNEDSYQFFCPVDQEEVLYCRESDLPKVIDQILERHKKWGWRV